MSMFVVGRNLRPRVCLVTAPSWEADKLVLQKARKGAVAIDFDFDLQWPKVLHIMPV